MAQMTQAEFNQMLSVAISQGIGGGTYVSKFSGEEIDKGIDRAFRVGENLLDNWYFADPINQRGETEYTVTGATTGTAIYTIDRWILLVSSGATVKLAVINDGIQLTVTPPSGKKAMVSMCQKLTGSAIQSGVHTLSWLYTSDCLVRPFVEETVSLPGYLDFPASATPVVASIQGRFSGGKPGTVNLQINTSVTANVKLYAAKLELGDHQTLAHQDASGNWVLNDPPPDKAIELVKCQRYQMIDDLFGVQLFTTNTGRAVFVPLPVSMRATPEIVGTPLAYDLQNNYLPGAKFSVRSLRKNGVLLNVENVSKDIFVTFIHGSGLDANL